MGLYKRKNSRLWWMGYTVNGEQRCESTKTASKDLAKKIWKKREGEIALGLFQVGWPGERMTFGELSELFFRSHSSTLSPKSQINHQMFLKNLRAYFGDRKLTEIDERTVVEYRNDRRRQPLKPDPKRTVKGATVNRELACLHCIFQFVLKRKYIGENPTAGVKHFDERHERPSKRMLAVEEEHRILEAAPPHLRVAIVLLVQTGGRTYSEGLSLRWDQVDLVHGVLHLGGSVKTTDSAQPLPLSRLACDVLKEWKKEQSSDSLYVFPSPRKPGKPIRSVKRAWRTALKKAGVPYFPIYNLRHVFCTRLSWVAPDAVVQRAMRHSSPETKRHYQLGMVDQVREGIERANEKTYQNQKVLRIIKGGPFGGKFLALASEKKGAPVMESTKYVGMDVHKQTISIAVMNSAGKLIMESIIETKAITILQFIQGLRGDLHVTFEEGTWAAWLYDLLKPHVTKVVVCNPRKNALLKEGNKSDRIDARKLAELLRNGSLSGVYHGENGVRMLKELSRSYLTISKDLGRVMNRVKALYRGWAIPCAGTQVYAPRHRSEWLSKITEAGVRRRAEHYYQQLDALQALRHEVRKDLLVESRKHNATKLLRQVPCIGPIRAAQLVALMQTPHRFRTKRQLWTYSGLGLETHDSAQYRYVEGQLQRSKKPQQLRGLNTNHNHDLKNIFKGAATMASISTGPFHDFYEALLTKGMQPTMARLTLARKIAAITLIVWKKGVRFDPEHLKQQAA